MSDWLPRLSLFVTGLILGRAWGLYVGHRVTAELYEQHLDRMRNMRRGPCQ